MNGAIFFLLIVGLIVGLILYFLWLKWKTGATFAELLGDIFNFLS
jgi:hypothetical protein